MSEEKSARELVDEIRNQLSYAASRRTLAIESERFIMLDIAHWVRQGEGILSVAEMARLAGVSRDTIYQILKEESQ